MTEKDIEGYLLTNDAAPCPFCDNNGKMRIVWRWHAWVECPKCHATGPKARNKVGEEDYNPIKHALDLWNESAHEGIQ